MSARTFALGHSELMAQHEDFGVLPHYHSRRDTRTSDTARVAIKKISLNRTSQKSSHAWQAKTGRTRD
jgi:hypothetical protein